jgi:DNA/RNA-binding domain of Phe-tRNA-synthetase-like protein
MGIIKYYEMSCEICCEGEVFDAFNKKYAKEMARENGWIITQDEKVLCRKWCYKEFKKQKK